jgi:hypothetical protein
MKLKLFWRIKMKKLKRSIYFITFSMLTLSIGLLSCDGGGGGSGGGGQPSGQTTTIRGNLESVVAIAPQNHKPSMLAKIKDFFTLSKTANAQDNQIIVTFVVDGEIVDVVTVEPDGDFEGVVPVSSSGNNVTLVFESDGDEESVVIFVPPVDAVIILVLVNFQEDDVEVADLEFEGPLRCENVSISLVAEQDDDIVIDGNGGPCVLAGNCHLSFDAANVIFQDCGGCFDARGNSVLEVSADHDIVCEADNCAMTRGTSSVSLSADDEINLSCIDARGNSEIVLDAPSCNIGDIVAVGNATVDTSACDNIAF